MKKKNVIKNLYKIRCEIIDETVLKERLEIKRDHPLIKNYSNFVWGYKVGLSQAAMILLDKIYDLFPEEKDEEE